MPLYDGPIIDAHHHFWDLGMDKHPWLRPGAAAAALPRMETIRRTYLPADYRDDIGAHDIAASVHVEALWSSDDPLGEPRWIAALQRPAGIAAAHVAAAPLGRDGAQAILETLAGMAHVRGIRSVLSNHPDPARSFEPDPDKATRANYVRDVATLRDLGFVLDVMAFPYQAPAIAALADNFADLRIVLNHCGSPVDRDHAGLARWRDGLALLAERSNIAVKLSNAGIYYPGYPIEGAVEEIAVCLGYFGVARTLFASDYPVAKRHVSFNHIVASAKQATAGLSAADQWLIFHDNAAALYRL